MKMIIDLNCDWQAGRWCGADAETHSNIAMELLNTSVAASVSEEPPEGASSRPAAVESVIAGWEAVVGKVNVLRDEQTRQRYARCTLPRGTTPMAIVRPNSTTEVAHISRIAMECGIPLHPISCGKNWGYGDACAPGDGWAIVDLGRMDRIIEVNNELAYAVIEPGVSQGKMYEYLRERHPSLMLDVTGAGPDASIVGNTLQRGFGHTPYGNHFAHTSGLEVVLAGGRVIRTGFARLSESAAAQYVFPWGQGPFLDGLFTQSHLGIVTRMGIWLMPKPEVIAAFAFTVAREDDIGRVIETLRWLKLNDVVRSTVHVANDLRVISAQRGYPHEMHDGLTALPDSVRSQLRRQHGIGAWNVMGGLYGTRSAVAAAKRTIRAKFAGLARVQFFDRRKLAVARGVAGAVRKSRFGEQLARKIASAESVYDLLCGVPGRDHLRGSAWRAATAVDGQQVDPGKTGLIWISPVIPATADASQLLCRIMNSTFAKHGFDPLLTLSTVTDRAFVAVSSIHFDRDDPTECLRAQELAEELKAVLAQHGLFAYRTGI